MAETLRELVVALSLDSSNFSRNMRTINQQIKEAESTFRLAGAGVGFFPSFLKGSIAYCRIIPRKNAQASPKGMPAFLFQMSFLHFRLVRRSKSMSVL